MPDLTGVELGANPLRSGIVSILIPLGGLLLGPLIGFAAILIGSIPCF
jgi:hypothetical protein